MSGAWLRVPIVALGLALVPAFGEAQTAFPLHHLELSVGAGFIAGTSLGSQDANLRTATANQPYRLFTSSSHTSTAPIIDLRAGVSLTRRYGVEAHAAYGHPELRTALSSDVEGAPSLTAVERLDQYLIDGGVVIGLDQWSVAGLHPFAAVGGGYVRQLHQDLVVIEEGGVFYAGGGVKHGLVSRPRGFFRGLGARADVRLNLLKGGINFNDGVHPQMSVSGSLFVVF